MALPPRRSDVKRHIEALFDELLAHDGFGSLTVEMRLLRRGQKEVILHCGKQYRYVLDFVPTKAQVEASSNDVGSCTPKDQRQASPIDPGAGEGGHHTLRG
jgi:hypothetical protein